MNNIYQLTLKLLFFIELRSLNFPDFLSLLEQMIAFLRGILVCQILAELIFDSLEYFFFDLVRFQIQLSLKPRESVWSCLIGPNKRFCKCLHNLDHEEIKSLHQVVCIFFWNLIQVLFALELIDELIDIKDPFAFPFWVKSIEELNLSICELKLIQYRFDFVKKDIFNIFLLAAYNVQSGGHFDTVGWEVLYFFDKFRVFFDQLLAFAIGSSLCDIGELSQSFFCLALPFCEVEFPFCS